MALQKGNAEIHAVGTFNTTAGAIVNAGTGDWTAANIAVGIADVTLGVAIDVTERLVFLTSRTINLFAATIPANDTDTVFRVHIENDVSADTDGPLDFMVIRCG